MTFRIYYFVSCNLQRIREDFMNCAFLTVMSTPYIVIKLFSKHKSISKTKKKQRQTVFYYVFALIFLV